MEDFASCTLPISRYGKGPKASVMLQLNNFDHLVEDVSMAWPKFLERSKSFSTCTTCCNSCGRLGWDTGSAHGHNHRGYSCTFHISCPEIVEQGICSFFQLALFQGWHVYGSMSISKKTNKINRFLYLQSLQTIKRAWGFFGVFRLFSLRDESHCLRWWSCSLYRAETTKQLSANPYP